MHISINIMKIADVSRVSVCYTRFTSLCNFAGNVNFHAMELNYFK